MRNIDDQYYNEEEILETVNNIPEWVKNKLDMEEYIIYLQNQLARVMTEKLWIQNNGDLKNNPKLEDFLNLSAKFSMLYSNCAYDRHPLANYESLCKKNGIVRKLEHRWSRFYPPVFDEHYFKDGQNEKYKKELDQYNEFMGTDLKYEDQLNFYISIREKRKKEQENLFHDFDAHTPCYGPNGRIILNIDIVAKVQRMQELDNTGEFEYWKNMIKEIDSEIKQEQIKLV